MPHPLDPFAFGNGRTTLRNRTVLAAMTNKQSHADGVLSDEEIRWLLRRAEGGFGIVTTAAAHVAIIAAGVGCVCVVTERLRSSSCA